MFVSPCYTSTTSEPPKRMQGACVFDILTWKCAWRHSGVPFFDNLSTSELPKVVRTPHVFKILTSKCASRQSGVQFLDIWTSKSAPKARCFVQFYLKCASRHSGMPFFLSALSSYLRTRRFSEPTFRPSRHTNPRKNTAFHDFPNISRRRIFFLLTFAQLHLLSSDSTSLLCAFHRRSAFSTLHIVGS